MASAYNMMKVPYGSRPGFDTEASLYALPLVPYSIYLEWYVARLQV
jgi:hypothetical protein